MGVLREPGFAGLQPPDRSWQSCQYFRDAREGEDRWGTPYKEKWGCGTVESGVWDGGKIEAGDHICPAYIEESCPGCLAPDEPIWTERGLIPIGMVVPGDVVVGIDGKPDLVSEVTRKQEPLLRLDTASRRDGLRLTGQHRCFSVPRAVAHAGVRYLHEKGRPLLGVTRGQRPVSELLNSDLREGTAEALRTGDFWLYPVLGERDARLSLPLDEGLAWLYGLWLGDGWIAKRGVGIALHGAQAYLADRAVAELRRLGVNASWRRRDPRNLIEVEAHSVELRDRMEDEFGRGAFGKQVPFVALSWPERLQRALIAGYYDADGDKTHKSGTRFAVTRSRALANGLYALSVQAGMPLGMARYDNRGDLWCLTWWQRAATSKGFFSEIDGRPFYWTPVTAMTEAGSATEVVDIGVERTESFLCGTGITHNCKNAGNRTQQCERQSCDTICGDCGGGTKSQTIAYCGQKRSHYRDDAWAEMGSSLRLDRYTAKPAPPAPTFPVNWFPVCEQNRNDKKTGTWQAAVEQIDGKPLKMAATTLKTVYQGIRSKKRPPLREKLGISEDCVLAVNGLILDDMLDEIWDDREIVYDYCKESGVDIMVTPQFSAYSYSQNWMAVYNANRVFRWYEECQDAGFDQVALQWPGLHSRWLCEEFCEFARRSKTTLLSFGTQAEKQTTLSPHALLGARIAHEGMPDDCSFICFGPSTYQRIALMSKMWEGRDVVFSNVNAYAGSVFYVLYPYGSRAPAGMTKGEVFGRNVKVFNDLVEKALAMAK